MAKSKELGKSVKVSMSMTRSGTHRKAGSIKFGEARGWSEQDLVNIAGKFGLSLYMKNPNLKGRENVVGVLSRSRRVLVGEPEFLSKTFVFLHELGHQFWREISNEQKGASYSWLQGKGWGTSSADAREWFADVFASWALGGYYMKREDIENFRKLTGLSNEPYTLQAVPRPAKVISSGVSQIAQLLKRRR